MTQDPGADHTCMQIHSAGGQGKLSRKTARATDGRNSIIPATNRTIIKHNLKNPPAQINFIKVFKVVSHCFRNWIHLSSSNKGLVLQEQNEAALS